MPELSPLAQRIAELNELRSDPNCASSVAALRDALADRSQQVVAKAAELCGDLGKDELLPELLRAYGRMFINPLKKDPGCLAKKAIARAAIQLDADDLEPYRRGIKYQQFEPVWGGQEDTAAGLRAICASGMVARATCLEAMTCLADLLADPCKAARLGAAEAIGSLGHWEAVPLLRLKLLVGDSDAEVLGECCSALLRLTPDEGIDLVLRLLSGGDASVRVHAALALGESRHEQAFEPLCTCWESETERTNRTILLTCIGLLRSAESRAFLVDLIDGPDEAAASDAIAALAPYAALHELRQQVERAVTSSGSSKLRQRFIQEFPSQPD